MMRILFAYQNTKAHGEDFAITPYMFWIKPNHYKAFGLGICWGWFAIGVTISFNAPKNYPTFINLTRKTP